MLPPKKRLPIETSSNFLKFNKSEPSVEDLLRGIAFQVHELGHGGVLQVLSQQGRGWMQHKGGKDLGGVAKIQQSLLLDKQTVLFSFEF